MRPRFRSVRSTIAPEAPLSDPSPPHPTATEAPWSPNDEGELEATLPHGDWDITPTEQARVLAGGLLVVALLLGWWVAPALYGPALLVWWVANHALRWRDDPHLARWLVVAAADAAVVVAASLTTVPLALVAVPLLVAEAAGLVQTLHNGLTTTRIAIGPVWVRVSPSDSTAAERWIPLESLRPRLVRTRSGLAVELSPGELRPVDERALAPAAAVVSRLQEAARAKVGQAGAGPPPHPASPLAEPSVWRAGPWIQVLALVAVSGLVRLWQGDWLKAAQIAGGTLLGLGPWLFRLSLVPDRRSVYEVVEVLGDPATATPTTR